jgi:hypothetical protein
MLTQEELFAAIIAARPGVDEFVYLERRGEEYGWSCTDFTPSEFPVQSGDGPLPNVWIYYSGRWPNQDESPDCWRAFFADLLAEMESMAGGDNRCRWPFDDPWPNGH